MCAWLKTEGWLSDHSESSSQEPGITSAALRDLFTKLIQSLTRLCYEFLLNKPVLEGCYKVSPEPSLLRAEKPQLSRPFFIGEVFHPSDHFCGPPLDLLQQVHVLLVLRAPELDAVLQDTGGFLGCEHTLVAHVQLFIHQYSQVLLCRAALNPFIPQPVLVLGVAPTQVQDLALGLVKLHEVDMGPLLKPVQHVNCTTQLGVICKLAEHALNPTVYVIDEDIKQYWPQYRPFSSSHILAFLTPSLHSSQHTCPCFHCLCISFLPFSLTSRFQLSHDGLLPSFPDFLHPGIKSSCTLWKVSLKICQLCSAPLSLRAVSQGVLLTNFLNSWQFAFLKFRAAFSCLCFSRSFSGLELPDFKPHLPIIISLAVLEFIFKHL
ncbi:hypothetical protein QYF61_018234 [Mycteria americana]|uniref:Uncharacterized protein n=1 Tax=Mycteria americana TaxID=33587 RepID=A0AAN7RUU1_MYCAM|nr:hypothetical protein QYF61_018234 [Mycteria americana]